MSSPFAISPMQAASVQNFVYRTYRETGLLQWVRETYTNAIEANATHVLFGLEWQAVESMGVYRRIIADNGKGMTADELCEFFNTYGGGGKPIGGVHENFGVGAKTALLPWNTYGVVVVSWVDGEGSMIWITRDSKSGEFGLRYFEAEDPDTGDVRIENVVAPFNDEDHGCDWNQVKPDWIDDHGTVIVLLGKDGIENTVLGDPTRTEEATIKGVSAYLNRRIWEIPAGVTIQVDELRDTNPVNWPRNEQEAHGPAGRQPDRRTNTRKLLGAAYYVTYPKKFKGGKLADRGTVELTDGTHVDWYLWEGKRPELHTYAEENGYVAALYKNEIYNFTRHHSTYRSAGLIEAAVRLQTTLIFRPPELDEENGAHQGVYPRTDRNALLLKGGPAAGRPLPYADWTNEFADLMPESLRQAIRNARGTESGSIEDQTWIARLAERFGKRWRITKLRANKGGKFLTTPTQPGARPRTVKRRGRRREPGPSPTRTRSGLGGELTIGSTKGRTPAVKRKVGGAIPSYDFRNADEFEPGIFATWNPKAEGYENGVVFINKEHAVLQQVIEFWQQQYSDTHAETVQEIVLSTYGEIAIAKIAHSEHLKTVMPSDQVEGELRSDHALTLALLGLIAEESVLSTRIGGKLGKRRYA